MKICFQYIQFHSKIEKKYEKKQETSEMKGLNG